MRILSVDWDFFFPVPNADPQLWQLYDWGHSESSSLFLNHIWYPRAGGFLANNFPLPGVSSDIDGFWDRFTFSDDCQLYYADSHSQICKFLPDAQEVINFDAHHDAGYAKDKNGKPVPINPNRVSCADWAQAFVECLGGRATTIYPRWKNTMLTVPETSPNCKLVKRTVDTGKAYKYPFDLVFVCRSGGWTPPWLDDRFEQFVIKDNPLDVNEIDDVENRAWDQARAEDEQKQMMELIASMKTRERSEVQP